MHPLLLAWELETIFVNKKLMVPVYIPVGGGGGGGSTKIVKPI